MHWYVAFEPLLQVVLLLTCRPHLRQDVAGNAFGDRGLSGSSSLVHCQVCLIPHAAFGLRRALQRFLTS